MIAIRALAITEFPSNRASAQPRVWRFPFERVPPEDLAGDLLGLGTGELLFGFDAARSDWSFLRTAGLDEEPSSKLAYRQNSS